MAAKLQGKASKFHVSRLKKTEAPSPHMPMDDPSSQPESPPRYARSPIGPTKFRLIKIPEEEQSEPTEIWEEWKEISLNHCIAQVFFLISTFMSESGILLVMAFDHYIAICYPLRYLTILTHALIGKIGATIFLRSFGTVFPMTFLLKRLTFCRTNILPHTVCEHIGLAKFSCDDIRVNIWYGFFVLMSTIALDVFLSIVSYMLILRAVFHIPSRDARHKALNTCGSYVCVIFLFYGPGIFSTLTQRFGRHISPHIHILLANVCILAPPMLNPIIYGIKTKQIWDQVTHILFSKHI
ncbi:olfactory receptor 52B4-like [Rhynchonycteris naso]